MWTDRYVMRVGTEMASPSGRVIFGMAGVIYTGAGRERRQADERWLAGAFCSTSATVRTECRSDKLVVVSCQHSDEVGIAPGTYRHSVPVRGGLQGVLYGHFFGTAANSKDPRAIAETVLNRFNSIGPTC